MNHSFPPYCWLARGCGARVPPFMLLRFMPFVMLTRKDPTKSENSGAMDYSGVPLWPVSGIKKWNDTVNHGSTGMTSYFFSRSVVYMWTPHQEPKATLVIPIYARGHKRPSNSCLLIWAGIFETASGIYRHDQMTRNLIRSIRSDFLQNFEIKARPLDTNQFSSRIPSSLSHIIHHILQHEGECRPQLVLGYLWLMFCSIMDRFWPSSTKAEKPPSRSPVSLAPLKTR